MSFQIIRQLTDGGRFRLAGPLVLLGLVGLALADNGTYRTSPHGSTVSGVWRVAAYPRGSCLQCHSAHEEGSALPYGLFTDNANRLCFGASIGGCHADRPVGGSAGYPAQEADRLPFGSSDPAYFEFNTGGIRVPGVQNLVRWPGQLIWEDRTYSPHYASPVMPVRDADGNGSCDNCHDVHGGANRHDMLDTLYFGAIGSLTGSVLNNMALCLRCHSPFGPAGIDDTSRMISYYYDRGVNPGSSGGHSYQAISGSQAGARMPCFECHNAHGSIGNSNGGPNRYLLSDQRSGWYDLTEIRNDNAQVRRFCFGCHQSSEGFGGGRIGDYTPDRLPTGPAAHRFSDSTHCYDCHGRDYSSPTSHNVHNPGVPPE